MFLFLGVEFLIITDGLTEGVQHLEEGDLFCECLEAHLDRSIAAERCSVLK